jgi:hypothetical protein
MTKPFYVNLQFHNEPFYTISYLFGRTLELTMDDLARYLNITNEVMKRTRFGVWSVIAHEDAYA